MEVWFPALSSEATWGSPGTAEGRLSEPAQSPTSSIYPASWCLSVLGIGVPHQLPLKKGFWSHGVGCASPQLSPEGDCEVSLVFPVVGAHLPFCPP